MGNDFVNKVYSLEKKCNIIQRLSGEKIFDLIYNDKGDVFIQEGCDNFYNYKLTSYECMELSAFFKELAGLLEDEQVCLTNKINEKVIDLMGSIFCTHTRPDLEKELQNFETKSQVIYYLKDIAKEEIKGGQE